MSLLLLLYPRDWRRRYGREMRALLAQTRLGPREVLDLVRGALDAHLNPQWPRRPLAFLLPLAVGVMAAALAAHALAAALQVPDAVAIRPPLWSRTQLFRPMQLPAALVLGAFWAVAAVGARRAGLGPLARFAALLAARFAADWGLLLVPLGAAELVLRQRVPTALWLAISLVEIALWGVLVAAVLGRTRIPRPLAFAVGCALELVLGSTDLSLASLLERGLPPGLVTTLEPLRIALWAGAVAALAGLGRRRRHPGDAAGAAVRARPDPDAPEPLEAVAGR